MKRPLVIFGLADMAQLAHFYFSREAKYEVVAFTVDAAYRTIDTFCELPVYNFEDIVSKMGPQACDMFIAVSYTKMNRVREAKYFAAKKMGYTLASYISPHATMLNEGKVGDNCFIFEDNTVQPFVTIGNNVTLWSGNHIGHHSTVEDHNFISSHVVVSGHCVVEPNCFLGVNATIGNEVRVGRESIIGAGACITKDVAPKSIYVPARSVKLDKTSDEVDL